MSSLLDRAHTPRGFGDRRRRFDHFIVADLQGPGTEGSMVRQMVTHLRSAKATTVQITNYRKDGSTFMNALSLMPVNDSNGEYR